MKRQIRVLGIDDSEFTFRDSTVPVVGVVMRAPSYIEGVMKTEVRVDGDDATDVIGKMVAGSRYRDQLRLIMIDGVTLGGFNIIDIGRLHACLEIPVATVTRDKPDMNAIKSALKKHFADWEDRFGLISAGKIEELKVRGFSVYSGYAGIKRADIVKILGDTTVVGAVPEPVRVAHIIATALARGESRGRA